MGLKIVLVDDEIVQHNLIKKMIENLSEVSEFLTYQSPKTFLFDWEELKDVDAVFLDVEMPEMNGLDLAKQLRQKDRDIPIVFMTAYSQFALESYEVNAFDYLLKPIDQEKVENLLKRLKSIKPTLEPTLFVELDGLHKLIQNQIYALEAQGHQTKIILENESLLVRESFSSLKNRLCSDFVMSHRSYLINLNHVKQVQSDTVILENNERIPLSRRMVKVFSEAFVAHYQKDDFSL